jgi:hypothetical protein
MEKQATPTGLINERTLMVMIGYDVTISSFKEGNLFFDVDAARASYLLGNFLMRLKAWENNSNQWNPKEMKDLVGRIPFVNLIPWLGDREKLIRYGISQLKEYINIIRPLITVTF